MTSSIRYCCNLCFNGAPKGYTLCYMPNNGDKNKYHLSSVEFGLSEMKDQVSAGGAIVSHLCEDCAKDISDEVKRKIKKIN